MNYYAIVNGINSLCGLTIAIVIVLIRSRKAVHLAYALFYFLLFLWTSSYFIWGTRNDFESSIFWLRMVELPVCFIHTAYLHFCLLFSETYNKYKKYLTIGYILSSFFFVINWNGGFFDLTYIRDRSPFRYWPHATPYLNAFIAFQITCIFLSFVILYKTIQTARDPLKARLKVFLVLAIVGWSGGLTNWFNFYDATPIPPIGNPAVTLYLLGSAYLIFKHDILGLNLVVRKTFVYTALTLVITLIYTLFILIFERAFQSVMGYRSLVISILSAMTIALLFNPLRLFFNKFIDRTFFGMDIEKLSSENILMKDELAKQDRMKAVATLAAGMAHEIKNPLTAIKTFTEHLQDKASNPAFVSQFQRIVGSEVTKIDTIVKQLLEFSKPTEPLLATTNIVQIINDTLQLLDAEFVKHKIELTKHYYADLVWIQADAKQLQQAFLNLILNSIQAMPEGGKLGVSVALKSRGVALSISDTGSGISEENLSHIFDPFFTTKEGGTGLGLAITHGIFKEHNCKIKVKSQENVGTQFEVFFNGT